MALDPVWDTLGGWRDRTPEELRAGYRVGEERCAYCHAETHDFITLRACAHRAGLDRPAPPRGG